MRGVILAAGRGSRLKSLTVDRPKAMVELGGRPLIEWQRAALRRAGIERIAAVGGYRAECLPRDGLAHLCNPRWNETQMVRSLACAARWLAAEDCIVSYADIVYGADVVAALARAAEPIAIAYDPDWLSLWRRRGEDPLADAETFRRDAETGRLLDIGARPVALDGIEGQYMGLLKFTPDGWRAACRTIDALPADAADRLDMTGLLRRLLADGCAIGTVPTREVWGEVDTPADLALYHALLARGAFLPPPAQAA